MGRIPLRRIRNANELGVEKLGIVQDAGQTIYRRKLQREFPPAPVDWRGQWRETEVYRLCNAQVSGLCGSIFLPGGALFSVCPWVEMLADKRVRHPSRLFQRNAEGPVLHLLGRNHENHGHFLFEYLPRVVAAEKILDEQGSWRIGICAKHACWQRPYLEMLGYGTDRIVEFWLGTTHVTNLFFVPLLSGISSLPDPALMVATIKRLRDAACKLTPSIENSPEPGRVAFISRSDSPNKQLLNETELIATARNIFTTVDTIVLSGMPLSTQLEAIARASLVIGPQGMGLSNMAFLRNRTLICLEAGSPPDEMAWEATYCMIAELGANQSLTLYGGQDRIPPHRNWIYPVERFEREMRRLTKLLGKGLYNTTA